MRIVVTGGASSAESHGLLRGRSSRPIYIAIALGFVLTLCACGNSVTISGRDQLTTPSDVRSGRSAPPPDQEFLYVADGSGVVNVYTFPQLNAVEIIGSNGHLSQECSDANGDVYILMDSAESKAESVIYEVAHGSIHRIRRLFDPGLPDSCSVDSETGDLAVANGLDQNNPYSPYFGDVAIYANGRRTPHMVYSKTYIQPIAITYAKKNLYVISSTVSSGYQLARVAPRSGTFSQISLGVKIETHPTPVLQWDGKYVTLATVENPRLPLPVYRLQISGLKAQVVATVKLASRENRPGVSTIEGAYAVAADNGKQSDILVWNYPKGGKAIVTTKQTGTSSPEITGLALSVPASQ